MAEERERERKRERERGAEGERKRERLRPNQKRVKWVRVAGESDKKRRGSFTGVKSDSERG